MCKAKKIAMLFYFVCCLFVLSLFLSFSGVGVEAHSSLSDFMEKNKKKDKAVDPSTKAKLAYEELTKSKVMQKLKEFFNEYLLLTSAVQKNPTVDLIIKNDVNDPKSYLNQVLNVFSNKTIIFYNSESLEETEKVNKTLIGYGARYSSDNSLSDLVFINLDFMNNNDTIIESGNWKNQRYQEKYNDFIQEVISLIHFNNELEDKRMPYIFMNWLCVGNSAASLTEGYADLARKYFDNKPPLVNNKLELSNEQRKLLRLRTDSKTVYSALYSYLVGPSIADFLNDKGVINVERSIMRLISEFGKNAKAAQPPPPPPQKKNLIAYVIGQSSCGNTKKMLSLLESLNPPKNGLVFFDLDDPDFYKELYTDNIPLKVKEEAVLSDLKKIFLKTDMPYVVVDDVYLGDISKLNHFVHIVKHGISPNDRLTQMMHDILKKDKSKEELEKRMKLLESLIAKKKRNLKQLQLKINSSTQPGEVEPLKKNEKLLKSEISKFQADLKKEKKLYKSVFFQRLLNFCVEFQKQFIRLIM